MSAVREGDREAFAAIYDRHVPAMFGLALRILKDRRDAEDLIHDVFLQVWNRACDYDCRRGSVSSWLLVRVRSRAIDRLRRIERARRFAIAARLSGGCSSASDPGTLHAPDAHTDAAATALEALSPPLRLVARLVYVEGWTCREVATRYDLPLNTVKSRLAAAKRRLRSVLCCEDE